ncbi:hypothetical protein CTI12_AA508140 [Artemisia annua]|uniref:DUF659 domain-containing protein n=1 Tax=Artemisia annua TaxID=35608 RepID=A0A2U1LB84_ARTAN|nr:hypothetical protein CTI12_AA508140 [Artemisia annua]
MRRSSVDLKVNRGLCANGILFNVLRNPQFQQMVVAINKALACYKAASSEKERTVLLDECARDVEKYLVPIKDICRGANNMYAEDFSGVEKTGVEISKFLLEAIESIGPSNVLQVVTDNDANCKAAGKEVEKLKRLKDCREALATTIVLNSWRDWAKKGDENTHKIGQIVCETIISDEFWEDVDRILAITKPIFLLTKFVMGEGAKMGEVYEKMDDMVGEIKDVMQNVYTSYFLEVEKVVLARWERMSIPLYCLRISENEEESQMLQAQYARFHLKKGLYSRPEDQIVGVTTDLIDWWSTYSSETPELAEIDSYKEGLSKKWDINPESAYLEGSVSRMEDMQWENLDED